MARLFHEFLIENQRSQKDCDPAPQTGIQSYDELMNFPYNASEAEQQMYVSLCGWLEVNQARFSDGFLKSYVLSVADVNHIGVRSFREFLVKSFGREDTQARVIATNCGFLGGAAIVVNARGYSIVQSWSKAGVQPQKGAEPDILTPNP